MVTYPFLKGRPLAHDAGAALLSFSDPGLAIAKRVFTTWMAGTWQQNFYRYLPSIISRLADGRRVPLTGVSGGGRPTLHLNALLEDSISLVGIPRTSILSPPSSFCATRDLLFRSAVSQKSTVYYRFSAGTGKSRGLRSKRKGSAVPLGKLRSLYAKAR